MIFMPIISAQGSIRTEYVPRKTIRRAVVPRSHRASDALPFNPDPDSAGRRQFLGLAGAGMLATLLPGCGSDDSGSQLYPQTVAMGQQAIQQAIGDPAQAVAAISVAMLKGNNVFWQQ